MGRVFQFSEIESGLVPDVCDFQAAATAFCEESKTAVEAGDLDGAFVFGSVAGLLRPDSRVAPNPRSDMDCFVVVKDYDPRSFGVLRSIARSVQDASGNKIAAQPIVYQRKQLENGNIPGMLEIDPMFGIDLTGSGRFVVGNDPAEYMRFSSESPFTHFNAFIAQKRRKLHNGFAQEPESEQGVRTIQRFLELPVSIGRKAIQALILDGQYDDESFWAADKKQVIKVATQELFGDDVCPVAAMEAIMDYDRKYNALLQQAVCGGITEDGYVEGLREIADYGLGIEWMNYAHASISSRLTQS